MSNVYKEELILWLQPIGDAVGSVGTGVEAGADRIGKGAEDVGQGKNPGRRI